MSTTTVVLLAIGGLGALILAVGLLGLDLDIGPVSLEAVAAMMGAFGFSGAAVSAALDARSPFPVLTSVAAGAVTAIPVGWLTIKLLKAASGMHTDATPTRDDLVGLVGVVVTPIPEQGYGEIRVTLGGTPVKLYATSGRPAPLDTQVLVVSTSSETSVVVEPWSALPGGSEPPGRSRPVPPT